jgi:hypothetical protein
MESGRKVNGRKNVHSLRSFKTSRATISKNSATLAKKKSSIRLNSRAGTSSILTQMRALELRVRSTVNITLTSLVLNERPKIGLNRERSRLEPAKVPTSYHRKEALLVQSQSALVDSARRRQP